MDIRIERDISTGVTSVELCGELSGPRSGLLPVLSKCAADCPTALIVVLSALRLAPGAGIAVFATASQKAMHDNGVPVMLVGAQPKILKQLAAYQTLVQTYPSHADAIRALAAWTPRWRREDLRPVAESVPRARGMVGDACLGWGLTHLRDAAQLIVSELVSNAITHTGQDFQVTTTYNGMFLRIGVRDRSSIRPRPPSHSMFDQASSHVDRGAGLEVVDTYATSWGSYLVAGGKVVWALLRP